MDIDGKMFHCSVCGHYPEENYTTRANYVPRTSLNTRPNSIKLRDDTADLFQLIKTILTSEELGYKKEKGDELLFTDENILHVVIEDFYDKLSKIALKAGIKLP